MKKNFARMFVILLLISSLSYVFWLMVDAQDAPTIDTNNTNSRIVSKPLTEQIPKPEIPTNLIDAPKPTMTLASQITDIADSFAQTAQFPVNSQPITQAEQVFTYAPFTETFTEVAYPSDNYAELTLSVATDRYQYFSGDDVIVIAQLKNVSQDASVRADACLTTVNQSQAKTCVELRHTYSNNWQFKNVFPAQTLEDDLPEELLVEVNVEVDGEVFLSNATFRYNTPAATVMELVDSIPNQEYLDIPLILEVHQAGYYFVSAVLYDQSKSLPLVQLQQEARLTTGRQQIVLKAHVDALKYHQDPGPYQLSNITLRRGAKEGEIHDKAGNSKSNAYSLQGFSFDRYLDNPYQDPLALERQQFLRRLSNSRHGGQ